MSENKLPEYMPRQWLVEAGSLEALTRRLLNSIEVYKPEPMACFRGNMQRTGHYPITQSPELSNLIYHHYQHLQVMSSPVLLDQNLYYGTEDGIILSLDLVRLRENWRWKTGRSVRSTPAIYNNRLYVGSFDGNLYCLDLRSGFPKWKFHTGDWIFASPLVSHDRVIFGGLDHKLHALDARSGKPVWESAADGWFVASPSQWNDYIICGSRDRNLYILRIDTGEVEAIVPIGQRIHSTAAISGQHAFFGTLERSLISFNLSKQSVEWTAAVNGPVVSSPAIDLANNRLFIGSRDGSVYAFAMSDGTPLWSYDTGAAVHASPSTDGRFVYVGNDKGLLVKLDAADGMPVQIRQTDDRIRSSVLLSEGRLMVGGQWLYIFD